MDLHEDTEAVDGVSGAAAATALDQPSAGSDTGSDREYPRLDLAALTVGELTLDTSVVHLLPEGLVREHHAIPVCLEGDVLVVAVCEPLDLAVLDQMELVAGHRIRTVEAPERDIRRATERYFTVDRTFKEGLQDVDLEGEGNLRDGTISLHERLGDRRDAPAVRVVDSILRGAVRRGASDIHVEPAGGDMVVRYRIDGVLHEVMRVPATLQEEVTSRIKLMSGLDITEHRLPQDGRIGVRIETLEFDLRVSTLLTVRGEKVAIRLLNKSSAALGLGQLGMTDEQQALFARLIARPYGMIVLAGPTGSGKTTSLYAALQEVDRNVANVTTIEDPVEYWLDQVNQVQVNVTAGLTFASVLRTVLRQDPDVIMVGEVRDDETARLAVQAAMTGHVVFSTIHANDAPGALVRLRDLKVPPFLIASTVAATISQRLVRRVCADCRAPYRPTAAWIEGTPLEGVELTHGAGCDLCMGTGYRGRHGIFEILPVAEAVRRTFLDGGSADALREVGAGEGMVPMRDAAIEAVRNGRTTVEEIQRVLPPEELAR